MTQLQETAETIDLERLYAFVIALRSGDFSARLPVEGDGRAAEIALNLNRHIENMAELTAETRRICDEVRAGRLGGQAPLSLPPGPWRDAVESLNLMDYHLTGLVRDLNRTGKALAQGKVRKATSPCEGEFKELMDSMHAAVDRPRGT